VVVRDPERLPVPARDHPNLTVTTGTLLDLDAVEVAERIRGCDALVSCLGHRLSFRGLFLPPHRLVTDTVRRLHKAVRANGTPTRLVLMSTSGFHDATVDPPISVSQKIVLGLLRVLLPPHADNEQAALYLRDQVGADDDLLRWVAVRPDSLVDADEVTDHAAVPAPVRSALFDSGRTSRINVGHFLARLAVEDEPWEEWRGRLPVLYNRESLEP
jgi:hypothetical protein